MGVIRTVLGDIAPGSVRGGAMFHEHLLWNLVPAGAAGDPGAEIAPEDRWQVDYRSNECAANAHQGDPGIAARELALFAADGGGLLVDQSVAGIGRDPSGLAAASRASGVHVVAAAGTYTAAFLDDATRALGEAQLCDRFTAEITLGLDPETAPGIRAGLIGEIGCSWPLEPVEIRALAAASGTQRATGAAISVHPGRHPAACGQILDILAANGADLSRVVLCHMDRTHPDGRGIAALLERGACVEWDFFGIESSHYWMAGDVDLPTDLGRLSLIAEHAARGHGDRLLIGQDICTKTRLRRWGGHGYGHVMRNVVPLMARRGFGAALIDTLCRANPLRLLTLTEAPA